MLALIHRLVERCSKGDGKFDQLIMVFKGKIKIGYRDWTKMELMRGDVNQIIKTIPGYKSTV